MSKRKIVEDIIRLALAKNMGGGSGPLGMFGDEDGFDLSDILGDACDNPDCVIHGRGKKDLSDLLETVTETKTKGHIFSDAEIRGKEAEIEYLQGSVSAFHDNDEKKSGKIKDLEKEKASLKSRYKSLDQSYDDLSDMASRKDRESISLHEALAAAKRSSEFSVGLIKKALDAIGNLTNGSKKEPLKSSYVDLVAQLTDTLSRPMPEETDDTDEFDLSDL